MSTPLTEMSTIEEIRKRFDVDVEVLRKDSCFAAFGGIKGDGGGGNG